MPVASLQSTQSASAIAAGVNGGALARKQALALAQAPAFSGDPDILFHSLLEYQWKGIGFPAASFRVRLRQDLAEHKYSEKDGAEQEMVGRAPLEFSARIPFLNNIDPGPQETWKRGTLFPTYFKNFFALCARRGKGVMQHPIFGKITCVLHECDVEVAAEPRDGCWCNVTWLETFDDTNSTAAILLQVSPIAAAIAAAGDVDAGLATLQPPPPKLPLYKPNFQDTMRSIQGVFDTASTISRSVAGQINNVGYRCNAIMDSINQAVQSPEQAYQSLQNGQMRDALDRLRCACISLNKTLVSKQRPIGLISIPQLTALPIVAQDLKCSMKDLIELNGAPIVRSPFIQPQTVVRYYLAA